MTPKDFEEIDREFEEKFLSGFHWKTPEGQGGAKDFWEKSIKPLWHSKLSAAYEQAREERERKTASFEMFLVARTRLLAILDDMTDRERQILMVRFGISSPKTLEEVGKQFGVTRERIRQIEAKALEKIRQHSKKSSQ